MQDLEAVVGQLWARLWAGEKIHVPEWTVESPMARPDLFKPLPAAWPDGQSCDYVWRQQNGSRVHAQCFVHHGQRTVRFHIDKWDPDHDLPHFLAHGLFETPIGIALGGLRSAATRR